MIKNKLFWLGTISVIFLLLKLLNPTFVQKLSYINYDFYQSSLVKGEVKSVTIIDIDEKSLSKIGQFPWRRDIFAKMFNILTENEAKVIAVDIFFSEKDNQNPQKLFNDLKKNNPSIPALKIINTNKIFIESIQKSKIVLPVVGEIQKPLRANRSKPKLRIINKGEDAKKYLYNFSEKITSLESINKEAKGIGSVSLLPGLDGVIRSVPMLLTIDKQIWPSLSMEAIRVSNNQKNLLIEVGKNGIEKIRTRKNEFITDQNGIYNIKFKKFNKDNYISAVDLLENKFDPKKIKNKIILIGASAQGIHDIVKIANGKVVPGVEVHAHIINNILQKDFITQNLITKGIENIILIISILLFIFVPMKIKPKWSIVFFGSFIFVISTMSMIFFQFNIYVDSLFNLVAGSLIFMISLYFRYLDESTLAIENDKKQMVLKKEREIAGEVQKKLFPKDKKVEQYIFAKNTPAKDVSGDYYDYYLANDHEIYFTLADVSGKGIKAGILMANAASVFRSLTKMNASVATTARYINNQVNDSSYQGMFITAVIGKINIKTKMMEYINLGHEPIMILDKKLNFEYVESTVPPLGVMSVEDDNYFEIKTINIQDKTILIYTDGVTEGYIDNKVELTVPGLEKEIKKIKSSNPKVIIEHVTKILTEDNRQLRDDITCLGISI
jgi:adenylate cyclase